MIRLALLLLFKVQGLFFLKHFSSKVIHKSLYESSPLYSTGSELRLNLQEPLLHDCPLTQSAKSRVKSHWNKTLFISRILQIRDDGTVYEGLWRCWLCKGQNSTESLAPVQPLHWAAQHKNQPNSPPVYSHWHQHSSRQHKPSHQTKHLLGWVPPGSWPRNCSGIQLC